MSINPRQIDIDDSGDNLSGTPHNNAWLQAFQDKIDKALGVVYLFDNATGTLNNYALTPATGEDRIWQWSGGADLTVTGIANGRQGDRLIIKNVTSLNSNRRLALNHLDTASLAANRLFNIAQSAPTPLGPGGWATYIYHGSLWVLVDHGQGSPLTAPFNAANFVGWTPVVNTTWIQYELRGAVLQIFCTITGATVPAGASTAIFVLNGAYGGFLSGPIQVLWTALHGAPTLEAGFAQVAPGTYGTDRIAMLRGNIASWPAGTTATYWTGAFPVT